jgi:hypothetical protein
MQRQIALLLGCCTCEFPAWSGIVEKNICPPALKQMPCGTSGKNLPQMWQTCKNLAKLMFCKHHLGTDYFGTKYHVVCLYALHYSMLLCWYIVCMQ